MESRTGPSGAGSSGSVEAGDVSKSEPGAEQKVKPSRYNMLFERDGQIPPLLFNTLTRALLEVEPDDDAPVRAALARPGLALPNSGVESTVLRTLAEHGFLVEQCRDERAELQFAYERMRFSSRGLGLTILPTLRCNMACRYCFSEFRDIDMSPEIEQAIVSRMESAAKSYDSLHVTWFGGEPLLRMDVIRRLSDRFRKHFEKYHAGVITNALLLTDETTKELVAADVRSAQVTIDGPAAFHDARRPLRGGGRTFERIMDNVSRACESLHIAVRVNCDQEMIAHTDEMVAFLQMLHVRSGGKLRPYLFPLVSIRDRPKSHRHADLTWHEFSRAIGRIYKGAIEKGLINDVPWVSESLTGLCCANVLGGHIIDPEGNLFRCWEEPSGPHDRPVGHISRERQTAEEAALELKYLSWDECRSEDCDQCIYLPLCMGGCARIALSEQRPGKVIECCERVRHMTPTLLRLRFLSQSAAGKVVRVTGERDGALG
jgi:uncharacterized protein